MLATQEEAKWRSVLDRDKNADGAFVYAVRSTGVYCRPSCPSRRPQRQQVLFFAQPRAAEQAGFRPCLRCKPIGLKEDDPNVEIIEQVRSFIEQHLLEERAPTLAEMGAHANTSPYHLQRTFKRIMGVTPRQYAHACRVAILKKELKKGESVTKALYEAGYSSSSRLYEQAPSQLGMTPATYRQGGAGMQISYAIVDSPLGRLLVAATTMGVCAVSIGGDDSALEAEVNAEYPAAQISRDEARLAPYVNAILNHLQGTHPHLDLPLDVQATAFQMRVWDELRKIPYGDTRSYSEVAQAIGEPGAVRAVARACATNRVALVIPCHRVIARGGKLNGYRWSIERKRALLEMEKERSDTPAPGAKGS
ncbi:MAG: bifunctional DNA-binding transcriptional regulator/O6-methylguanine-DNA methyltransferase Ada [Chloroflexi bacterium]|nr:bifunctional DNA-binding transcriptional regulator/O6-methylguanine-DNA methyltransferase Ada [Chloroflexota bacterium]